MSFEINAEWVKSPEQSRVDQPDSTQVLDDLLDYYTTCILQILADGKSVTEIADDRQLKYKGPTVSAFALAEWFIGNWWRLRWEPSPLTNGNVRWRQAHETTSIGGGWIWPRIIFDSDGEIVTINSYGSEATETEPISYISDDLEFSISAPVWEDCIDTFVYDVITRISDEVGSSSSPISDFWDELRGERENGDLTSYRRLEALLGENPDEGDEFVISQLERDRSAIGNQSTNELAAEMSISRYKKDTFTAMNLLEIGFNQGIPVGHVNTTMHYVRADSSGVLDSWKTGKEAAENLRSDEKLHESGISDNLLMEMSGLPTGALDSAQGRNSPISFRWSDRSTDVTVFCNSNRVFRRYDAARLLGDKLIIRRNAGALRPVTNTNTFRQKMQRSFATELLCPLESLTEQLGSDYSDDSIKNAADHFIVPVSVVKLSMKKNRVFDRNAKE